MKRSIILIGLIICSVHTISQVSYLQRFATSDFSVRDTLCPDNQIYSYFQNFDGATLYQPGQPALPVIPVKFLIPTGSVIDSIRIQRSDTTVIYLGHKIIPYQPQSTTCINCPPQSFATIDSTVYFSVNGFPYEEYSTDIGLWHTAQIITLNLCPFKYYPLENKLVIYNVMYLNVYYTESDNENKLVIMERDFYSDFLASLSAKIKNPEDIDSYVKGINLIEAKEKSTPGTPNMDYVVIVPNNFLNSAPLTSFIDWKKRKGVDIGVVSLQEVYDFVQINNIEQDNIGANNSFLISDNPAKIRMYLKSVYDNGGCKYVLIVGDDSRIPSRSFYAYHDTEPDSYVKTDKYFADYTSDYEVDGDGKYGEISSSQNPGDLVDFYPESYVGRIPCSSIDEFDHWVKKLLSFEQNPGNGDASYLNSFVMTMADEPQNSIKQSTYDNLNFFQPVTIFKEIPGFDSTPPTMPVGSAIIESFNTTPSGWWTWDNHGSPGNFVTMSNGANGTPLSMITSNANSNGLLALQNGNKYGIISTNCCEVANYSVLGNMVDAALFNQSGGAVAIAGNTDIGWWPTGQQKLDGLTSVIRACHLGFNQSQKRYCTADWEWFAFKSPRMLYYYETYLTHNYFGDPEMMYYTKAPIKIIANITPRHIALDENNTVEVTITNLQINQKATVCLYQSSFGGDYQVIEEVNGTNSGNVNISFVIPANTLQTGNLNVTISGFNLIPYTDEILISPSCNYTQNAEEITGTAFYSFRLFKDHDVVVKPGAILTITGEVYFVPEAKIVVEPGGKLIIDGGTLGTSCEDLWQGIEVWGYYNQSQLSNQGEVNVINGGIIKEAICGIKNFKSAFIGYDVYNTGGIIKCSNSRFVNNKTAISYHPYYYSNHPNLGYFKDCTFEWDDNFILPSNPLINGYPEIMVSLHGLNLIAFSNCKFVNSMTTTTLTNRGYGIKASNSNFSVKGADNTYDLSKIEGFYYGISCGSVNPRVVRVMNTTLHSNLRGIYCSNQTTFIEVIKNKLHTRIGNANDFAYGLYLDNTTGYSVQENSFEGNYTGTDTEENGIIVNNSGKAPNEIYNNSFNNLQYGIRAQDLNRDPYGSAGLVCKCNDFMNNQFDEKVVLDMQSPSTWGIAAYQGDDLSDRGPAGNTFSSRDSGTGDITNDGARFEYYHHLFIIGQSPRTTPLYYNNITLRQTDRVYDKPLSCPSKLGGSIITDDELILLSENTAQKETQLLTLIDGGNTEETTENIIYSISTEAVELRDELLGKSPYLSDTVMQTAIKNENVLPNVMIRDILTANPHSAISEIVLNELDNRIDPMPDELYNQILECENIVSPKEIREVEIASIKSDRMFLYDQLIKYYLADTTGLLMDSLISLLNSESTVESKYLLSTLHLEAHDTVSSANTMLMISDNFNLTVSQQALHEDYIAWFGILKEMNTDTIPGIIPDSLQLIRLSSLMLTAQEPIKSFIREILVNNGAITYKEPYLINDELKKSRIKRTVRPVNNDFSWQMKVNPNPSNDYVIISFNLRDKNTVNNVLEIYTVQGVNVITVKLANSPSQFILPLNDFTSGTYIASLRLEGIVVENQKIIVLK